jgi:hypothetical protein
VPRSPTWVPVGFHFPEAGRTLNRPRNEPPNKGMKLTKAALAKGTATFSLSPALGRRANHDGGRLW